LANPGSHNARVGYMTFLLTSVISGRNFIFRQRVAKTRDGRGMHLPKVVRNKGLIRDSGRRRNGRIIWTAIQTRGTVSVVDVRIPRDEWCFHGIVNTDGRASAAFNIRLVSRSAKGETE
jgi:hypothetical protein